MLAEKETERNRRAGVDVKASPPYWKIFKQAFPQLINVFLVFFVTLTVFPAIHSGIYCLSESTYQVHGKIQLLFQTSSPVIRITFRLTTNILQVSLVF
jgi:hypothetical protein